MILPVPLIKAVYSLTKSRSLRYRERYRPLERLGREEMARYQLARLRELLRFVYDNNAFYRELWDAGGVGPSVDSLDDLERFPVVTKAMLRAAAERNRLISVPYAGKRSNFANVTTGSSGEPFRVVLNRECLDERVGSMYAIQEWYGLEIGDRWAWLWRGPLQKSLWSRCREAAIGKYVCSAYDPHRPVESAMNEGRCAQIVRELDEIRPKVIDGFVSALVFLSRHIIERRRAPQFRVGAIVTGGEFLSSSDRATIEEAFGCRVFNRYGGTEFSVVAHECEAQAEGGHALHTIDYRGILETAREGRRLRGVEAPILFTDYFSRAMPLIRYSTGDMGVLAEESRCPCGRTLGLLKEVVGRINDAIVFRDGSWVSSHVWHHYVKKCLGIRKYQLIQEDLDRFTMKVVLDPGTDAGELEHVKGLVRAALRGAPVEWRTVDDIPLGSGGKLQQCVSKLPRPGVC